jgi:hypothetical protein
VSRSARRRPMRLRRVAIDIKKQVRGRTVRTAERSLAGQSRPDDTVRVISRPKATPQDANPCLVLATDVDGIPLVHEVGSALTVANQGCDECRATIAHLVQSGEHRVAAGERPGRLAHHGQEI